MVTKFIHIMVVGSEALQRPDLPLTEICERASANVGVDRHLVRMGRDWSLRRMRGALIDVIMDLRAEHRTTTFRIGTLDLVGHGKGGELTLSADAQLTISSLEILDSIAFLLDGPSRVRLLGCNVAAKGAPESPFHGPSLQHALHLMFASPIGAPEDGLQVELHFPLGWLNEAGDSALTYWPAKLPATKTVGEARPARRGIVQRSRATRASPFDELLKNLRTE